VHVSLRPYSDASFDLPVAMTTQLDSTLCSSLLLVKTVHRIAHNGRSYPWLNSSDPLLGNLTSVHLCSVCRNIVREVGTPTHQMYGYSTDDATLHTLAVAMAKCQVVLHYSNNFVPNACFLQLSAPVNLTTPITVRQPVVWSGSSDLPRRLTTAMPEAHRALTGSLSGSLQHTVQCPMDSQQRSVTATCGYASGLNASVATECDGQQSAVSYQCPASPRCARWDVAGQQWRNLHCRTISLSPLTPGRAMVTCECSGLGTFTATVDSERSTSATLTLLRSRKPTRRFYGRSYWLVVVLLVVYSSLIVTLLVLRLRRAKESLAYLR
jgi:hypothetical protein